MLRNSYFSFCFIPPDNLSPILYHAHVSRTWWTSESSTGHVAVTEPFTGSGGRDLAGGPHTRHGAGGGTHLLVLQPGSATRATSTLAYSNPSPSHGSAMVWLGRRRLTLTRKASKGNNPPSSFFENMVNNIHDSFAFSFQKHLLFPKLNHGFRKITKYI